MVKIINKKACFPKNKREYCKFCKKYTNKKIMEYKSGKPSLKAQGIYILKQGKEDMIESKKVMVVRKNQFSEKKFFRLLIRQKTQKSYLSSYYVKYVIKAK